MPDKPTIVCGANFTYIELPDFPLEVDVDRDGNEAWTKEYLLDLGKQTKVIAVRSFFGHDRGDAFEMECTVYGDLKKTDHHRLYVWDRIEEDTAPTNQARLMEVLASPVTVRYLKLQFVCRVTGPNMAVTDSHPSYERWRGVFDFNIMLIGTWT